ncbi:MAG: hypothetical protein AAGK05_19290 [Pseudomonadota bacterium]
MLGIRWSASLVCVCVRVWSVAASGVSACAFACASVVALASTWVDCCSAVPLSEF